MDNITHGLLGATVGLLATPNQREEQAAAGKAVVWATLLASEIPDLDVFFGHQGLDYYVYHRGISHSLVAAPLVALLATAAVKVVFRRANLRILYIWSLLSVLLAHLLPDWTNGWGTRLLLPFSDARLGLDWTPIVDLFFILPLAAALIIAWRKPHLRRRAAAAVLTYLAVYTVGYRGVTHTLLQRRVASQYAGQPVSQIRVAPDLFNPLAWNFTVELSDRFEQGRIYPLGPVQAAGMLPKPPEDEVVRAIRQLPELKPYFDQFPFTLIQYEKRAEGYLVSLGDVRYRMAGRGMNTWVLLTPELQVAQIGDAH